MAVFIDPNIKSINRLPPEEREQYYFYQIKSDVLALQDVKDSLVEKYKEDEKIAELLDSILHLSDGYSRRTEEVVNTYCYVKDPQHMYAAKKALTDTALDDCKKMVLLLLYDSENFLDKIGMSSSTLEELRNERSLLPRMDLIADVIFRFQDALLSLSTDVVELKREKYSTRRDLQLANEQMGLLKEVLGKAAGGGEQSLKLSNKAFKATYIQEEQSDFIDQVLKRAEDAAAKDKEMKERIKDKFVQTEMKAQDLSCSTCKHVAKDIQRTNFTCSNLYDRGGEEANTTFNTAIGQIENNSEWFAKHLRDLNMCKQYIRGLETFKQNADEENKKYINEKREALLEREDALKRVAELHSQMEDGQKKHEAFVKELRKSYHVKEEQAKSDFDKNLKKVNILLNKAKTEKNNISQLFESTNKNMSELRAKVDSLSTANARLKAEKAKNDKLIEEKIESAVKEVAQVKEAKENAENCKRQEKEMLLIKQDLENSRKLVNDWKQKSEQSMGENQKLKATVEELEDKMGAMGRSILLKDSKVQYMHEKILDLDDTTQKLTGKLQATEKDRDLYENYCTDYQNALEEEINNQHLLVSSEDPTYKVEFEAHKVRQLGDGALVKQINANSLRIALLEKQNESIRCYLDPTVVIKTDRRRRPRSAGRRTMKPVEELFNDKPGRADREYYIVRTDFNSDPKRLPSPRRRGSKSPRVKSPKSPRARSATKRPKSPGMPRLPSPTARAKNEQYISEIKPYLSEEIQQKFPEESSPIQHPPHPQVGVNAVNAKPSNLLLPNISTPSDSEHLADLLSKSSFSDSKQASPFVSKPTNFDGKSQLKRTLDHDNASKYKWDTTHDPALYPFVCTVCKSRFKNQNSLGIHYDNCLRSVEKLGGIRPVD
eukprot:Nk52_evm15s279 gene=Nk52_evmTU15s279